MSKIYSFNNSLVQAGNNLLAGEPGGSGVDYTAGQYIAIEGNEISVTGLQPEGDYATEVELQTVSAAIPDVSNLASKSEVQAVADDVQIVSAAIPDTSNFIDKNNLIGGENVTISVSGDDVIVETTEMASGMQLIAGEGVKLTVSGDYLVASTDETVLWSGTYSGSVSDSNYITLSEDPSNFEYVMVSNGGSYGSTYTYLGSAIVWSFFQPFANNNSGVTVIYATRYDVNHTNLRVTAKGISAFNVGSSGITGYNNASTMNVGEVQLTKVVGINRKAS